MTYALVPRWCDVDFETLELRVTRSIWHQVVGNCKTEASAKPVPMGSYMAEDLLRWRRQGPPCLRLPSNEQNRRSRPAQFLFNSAFRIRYLPDFTTSWETAHSGRTL